MTLSVLKNTGQAFCGMPLIWVCLLFFCMTRSLGFWAGMLLIGLRFSPEEVANGGGGRGGEEGVDYSW